MFPCTRHWWSATLVVVALCVLDERPVLAAPPANDTCAGAEVVPASGPFPWLSLVTDLAEASTAGDPINSCQDVTNSIWYRFTPSTTRTFTISAGTDTGSTVEDSVISVYTSSGGCGGTFTEVDCQDDEATLKAALRRTLQAGTTYYIVVSVGPIGLTEDGSTVQLRISAPTAPANDACTGALVIPAGGPFPHLTALVDTTLATSTSDPAVPCEPVFSRSVWWQFTPAETSIYEISTCTNTATTVANVVVAVYSAPGGCAGSRMNVGCNSAGCGTRGKVQATLQAGTVYQILVAETLNEPVTLSETTVQLRVAKFRPPTVTTLAANNVSSSGALLHGTVNPNGLQTTVWFDWGTDATYGMKTSAQNVPAGENPVSLESFISGLNPGTLYHYRVVATNSLGISVGGGQTFQWSGNQPSLRVQRGTNGVSFAFTGNPGQTYWVEATRDFVEWINIATAVEASPGVYTFSDPESATLSFRFYRLFAP